MKVKATRIGFDGLCRRKEGSVFDWPDDKPLASWVEPAEEGDRAKAAAAEAKRAKERAEHAKAMREATGQNPSAVAGKLEQSEKALAEARAEAKAKDKQIGDLSERLAALEAKASAGEKGNKDK